MVLTKTLYADGVIRHVWHNEDATGVILMPEAASADAVSILSGGFSLIEAGYLAVEIRTLRPYAGFGPEPAAE